MGKGKRPASFENKEGDIDLYKSSLEVSKCEVYNFEMEALIIGDGGSANVHYAKGKFSCSDHTYIFKNTSPRCALKYIYLVLYHHLELLEVGFNGISIKNIAKSFIDNIKSPSSPFLSESRLWQNVAPLRSAIKRCV